MAKFEDTPRWKRGTWDAKRQRMVYPERSTSARQVRYLRRLCAERGVGFQRPRSRREAQSMIDRLLAAARHERAQRAARPQPRATQQRATPARPERWKFGRGQAPAQERKEIETAHLAGRTELYVAEQRWARMIDAETQRRRARKRKRRAHSHTGP